MYLVSITALLANDEGGMELVEWAVFAALVMALVLTALLTFGHSLQAKCEAVGEFINTI